MFSAWGWLQMAEKTKHRLAPFQCARPTRSWPEAYKRDQRSLSRCQGSGCLRCSRSRSAGQHSPAAWAGRPSSREQNNGVFSSRFPLRQRKARLKDLLRALHSYYWRLDRPVIIFPFCNHCLAGGASRGERIGLQAHISWPS